MSPIIHRRRLVIQMFDRAGAEQDEFGRPKGDPESTIVEAWGQVDYSNVSPMVDPSLAGDMQKADLILWFPVKSIGAQAQKGDRLISIDGQVIDARILGRHDDGASIGPRHLVCIAAKRNMEGGARG